MGKLESDFQFTGPLGNLSAYRMRGVDKIIIRKKGGASKKRIQNSDEFEETRKQNTEFSGRARGVHWMRCALQPLIPVADYSFYGPLNRLMKEAQYRDEESTIGKRSILLSKHGFLLQGFSLNNFSDLNNIVRAPLKYALSRDTLSAIVDIPQLIPEVNFFPPKKHPLFRFMAVLGVAPDLYHTDSGYAPSSPAYSKASDNATTQWLRVADGSPATALELKLQPTPPDDAYALILSVGICFATIEAGQVEQVKHAGSAKIVAVG